MVSKATLKSRRVRIVSRPESATMRRSFVILIRAVERISTDIDPLV